MNIKLWGDKSCSALTSDRKCRNGFFAKAACQFGDTTPQCMDEAACAFFFKEFDGIPKVVYEALHGSKVMQ